MALDQCLLPLSLGNASVECRGGVLFPGDSCKPPDPDNISVRPQATPLASLNGQNRPSDPHPPPTCKALLHASPTPPPHPLASSLHTRPSDLLCLSNLRALVPADPPPETLILNSARG